jgi:hypothetical protein
VLSQALSQLDVFAFIIIPLCLSLAFVAAVFVAWKRSGSANAVGAASIAFIATAIWLGVTWQVAENGALRRWNAMPPPFGLLVLTIVLLALRLAFGPVGRRIAQTIPLWVLIGVHGFRLPLEIAMHGVYERGIMPLQMTYTGRNYDIITGATAIDVAAAIYAGKGGARLARLWNIIGLLLLLNVVVIAILSTPRFAVFGDANLNTFVTYAPFVWLPAVMVLAALTGHLVIFRALARSARS